MACALTAVILSTACLPGCGNNGATKAAKESEATEREGSGSNDVETQDALQPSPAAVPEEQTVGVLFPSDENDLRWRKDENSFLDGLADAGYRCAAYYAGEDAKLQAEQFRTLVDEGAVAIVVAPVDAWSFAGVLDAFPELSIPVVSYGDLVMNTDAVKYFVTFDTREIGHQVARELIRRVGLNEELTAQETAALQPRTVEFFMGMPENQADLFFFNGIMEILQPFFEDGRIVCPSGLTDYASVCVEDKDPDTVVRRLQDILSESYRWNRLPDMIITARDSYAEAIAGWLKSQGRSADGSSGWPLITGFGAEAEAVRCVAGGYMDLTVFEDNRTLARTGVDLVKTLLSGDDPEVSNYEQYDNGSRLIRAIICDAQLIDEGNYQILVDNGYYYPRDILPIPEEDEGEGTDGETDREMSEDVEELPGMGTASRS